MNVADEAVVDVAVALVDDTRDDDDDGDDGGGDDDDVRPSLLISLNLPCSMEPYAPESLAMTYATRLR